MALFHVFVDGAADASPAGKDKLAEAVAAHYGLPIADLQARIASGRFRVKGNCDRATADSYIRDLTALGARCSLEEASPSNAAKTPLPFPAVTAQPPARPSQSALPPRQTTPPATARTATPPKGFQSGLAAAFSGGEQQVGSFGALDDGALLKLSSVDGKEDGPAADAFAPPPPSPTAAPAPRADAKAKSAAPAPAPAKSPKSKDEPIDMFAPPDADDANFQVDLAPDEVARAAKKKASIPPETAPVEPAPAANVPARASRPSLQVPPSGSIERASRPSLQAPDQPAATGLRDPKTRFAVGVLIAIVLGFLPAHLIAHVQESSAYEKVDANVTAVQHDAVTPDDYAALDAFRANQLARKHDERRNIALLAMLIWAAAGSGIAYVWFRRIRWDREPAA